MWCRRRYDDSGHEHGRHCDAADAGLAGTVAGAVERVMDTSLIRPLLEAALHANETAARQALIKTALKLLEGSSGPGSGAPAERPAGPGVPGVVGPSSGLTPPAVKGCPHPANQRTALGGFGTSGTSFYCRACGEQSTTAAGAALRHAGSLNSHT
jgi:hypothetical protein